MPLNRVTRRHRLVVAVLTALVVISAASLAWASAVGLVPTPFGEWTSGAAPNATAGPGPSGQPSAGQPAPPTGPTKPVNILLMGVDKRPYDIGRSDTMILMSLDPSHNELRLLDIPRDTRAEIPGHGIAKINSAYAWGGPVLAEASVSGLLGVPIDYYVEVDLSGAAKVIDTLGGVTIDVPRAMNYDDPTQDLHIHLKAGLQHLDGQQAIEFARWRSDGLGDIGRIGRQQDLIRALLSQVATPSVVPKIPALLVEARGAVRTDIPLSVQLSLAVSGYDSYRNGLVTETLPGTPKYIDKLSYWVPDQSATQALLAAWGLAAGSNS